MRAKLSQRPGRVHGTVNPVRVAIDTNRNDTTHDTCWIGKSVARSLHGTPSLAATCGTSVTVGDRRRSHDDVEHCAGRFSARSTGWGAGIRTPITWSREPMMGSRPLL